MVALSACWTQKEDRRLQELYAEGFTCRQIGKMMDKTKNAIIGRCHRLGFYAAARTAHKPPLSPIKTEPTPDEAQKEKPTELKLKLHLSKVEFEPVTGGVTLFERAPDGCCYIVETDAAGVALYCNKQRDTTKRRQYCEQHFQRMYLRASAPASPERPK